MTLEELQAASKLLHQENKSFYRQFLKIRTLFQREFIYIELLFVYFNFYFYLFVILYKFHIEFFNRAKISEIERAFFNFECPT